MEHNGSLHRLIKKIESRPEVPIGFEVAWNIYENGYTGKTMYWFSKDEVENSDNWQKDQTELMTNWLRQLNPVIQHNQMKPKILHFIPVVGMICYFRNFFKLIKPTKPEQITALSIMYYHMIVSLLLLMMLLKQVGLV